MKSRFGNSRWRNRISCSTRWWRDIVFKKIGNRGKIGTTRKWSTPFKRNRNGISKIGEIEKENEIKRKKEKKKKRKKRNTVQEKESN